VIFRGIGAGRELLTRFGRAAAPWGRFGAQLRISVFEPPGSRSSRPLAGLRFRYSISAPGVADAEMEYVMRSGTVAVLRLVHNG
jgi:hypothetical protein